MEVILVLGALALYLQDAMMLLHFDEVALVQTRRGWTSSTGADTQLVGRHLFLPNPFAPARAVFRVSWLEQNKGQNGQNPEHWPGLRHFIASLEALKPACQLMMGLLFLVLPLLLWRYPHPLALLALMAMIYLTSAWLVWQLWRYRSVFGLDLRTVLGWGFEALVCPPLAINMMRKVSLHRGLHVDPLLAAIRLCSSTGEQQLREQIEQRLSCALSLNDEGDPQYPALLAYRQRMGESTQ